MKIKKYAGMTVLVLIFVILTLGFTGCSVGGNAAAETQSAVARGDLTVKVNGNGKLSYSNDAKLTFGTAGQVTKVPVKKGDTVAKGDVLAQMDTSSLELTLSQAKTAEAAARVSLTQARMAVTQAQSEVTQAESAVSQAEVSLAAAQINLDRTEAVKEIKDDITKIEWQIETAKTQMGALVRANVSDFNYWATFLAQSQADLVKNQDKLAKLLAKDEYVGIATYEIEGQKYDRLVVEDVRLKEQQVKAAQQGVDLAKQNIDKSQQNVIRSQQNVEQANLSLAQATKAVEVAQKQLDYAIIVAPFDGMVADLGLKQSDFVVTPGVSNGANVYMVDPASLEINTEVDEIDIAGIQVGQKAAIELDAIPGSQFEGMVSSISMIPATNAQNPGVVVYFVKVRFAGNPPAGAKSGMSASVDIITHEKKGVVLVPNNSIKRNSQGQSIISVVNGQKVEEKQVVLGQTDGTNTEVISGLQEGDRILKLATDNSRSS